MKKETTLSQNLKKIRLKNGYTQKEIAEILDIKVQRYKSYELGSCEPSIQTIKNIANIYDINIHWFLEKHDILK